MPDNTTPGPALRTRDDIEDVLAAREAHKRLVHQIAGLDGQIATAQARRRTLIMKLLEVEAVMRGSTSLTRTERTLTDERRVLGALPGGVAVIASRTGLEKKRVQQLIHAMKADGRVSRIGYVWHPAHEGGDDAAA